MDFAAEPVLDIVPPPSRAAGRGAPAPADANGQTFGDHLDAVNEPIAERPPQNTTSTAPTETAAQTSDQGGETDEDVVDAETALLGGPLTTPPLPTPPPMMAAPVVVQIAASETQTTDAQASDETAAAPLLSPREAGLVAPTQRESVGTTTPTAPATDKTATADAKPASTSDEAQSLAQPVTAPQTVAASTVLPGQAAAQQTAPESNSIPAPTATDVQDLPASVREAIAATLAPAQHTAVQAATPRVAKTDELVSEEKPAGEAKSDAAPAADVKTQAPKPGNATIVTADAATMAQTQTSAPESMQNGQVSALSATTAQASTHTQHAAIDSGAQRAAPAATQVSQEIIRRFNGASTSFELRLDPPELGRVEVRMEVTRDHRITAVISADSPQALSELARHARDLEQQLQSAGLQLSDSGLSFDLRQGGDGNDTEQTAQTSNGDASASAVEDQQTTHTARPIGLERWRGVRVDMMV